MNNMCEQCPWRVSNHGKPHKHGFYRKDNLRRLWNEVRSGQRAQSCHLTDSSHPDHIAAGAPLGAKPRECPGSIALVARELAKAEADPEHYFRDHPRGLKKSGVAFRASRVLFGDTPLGLAIPPIPRELVEDESLCGRLP